MLPIHNEMHWVYKTAQLTRIVWFIIHLLILVLFLHQMPFFWLVLPLFFAAFLIPQWTGIHVNSFGVKHYPSLELIFSGLFLIVGCYFLGEYSSFLAYPALCAGIYSKPGKQRWLLWGGFSFVPFLAVLAVGLTQLGMGVIDGFFFFGIGLAVAKVLEAEKKTQILLEENRQQTQLLEEYNKEMEKVTLLEERNRLARDLHDTIGHTYTSVIMGLDAASFLLGKSTDEAKEQIDRLRDVMRKSLGEIRNHIHQISPTDEEGELSSQLEHIVTEFALHTKTTIHFEYKGPIEKRVSSQGNITLIRCLQESLTNAVRHGQAKDIIVTLEEDRDHFILTIKDNGIGIRDIKFGFGQNGMKERLESLQGKLTVESKVNIGTAVSCFLPVLADRVRGKIKEDAESIDSG